MFPHESSAVQVRVSTSGQEPVLESLYETTTPEQLSETEGLPVLLGSVEPSHSIVMFAGQTITGGVLSSRVMVCTQSVLFPHESSAVQVRVSISGQEPERTSENVMITPEQSSVAVGVPVLVGSVD